MIKVSNAHNKRLFLKLRSNIASSRKEEIEALKKKIEEKIFEIEKHSIDERNYTLLSEFKNEKNLDTISLFYYKNKIEDTLNNLSKKFEKETYKEKKDDEVSKKYSDEDDYQYFIKAFKLLKDNLYKLLVGDFQTIKKFIQDNQSSVLIYRGKPEEATILYKAYKETFENLYNKNLSRDKEFKRPFFELFNDMNVCPYCNRNYINPIYKDENQLKGMDKDRKDNYQQAPDIEHFFPKSMYPFLSLSISNLLPSCSFCNKIKSNVDTMQSFKSPYEIESEDFKFEFALKESNANFIKIKGDTNIQRNIEVLDLENMYNNVHSEFIDEVFEDIRKYPDNNKEFLKKFDISDELIEEGVYKKHFRNYYNEDDFNKHPLSKMTKDLFLQIKEDEE